ncbi:MAG: caspase family protein [Chitinophagaceae bacterium]
MPASVFSKNGDATRTTLYVADSNQLMVFSQNKCWVYTTGGELIRGPLVIRDDGNELFYPRISNSGKMIAFYMPEGDFFSSTNKIGLFNQDSGYVVGTYRLPAHNDLDRVRFSGDSVLLFYMNLLSRYKSLYIWATALGKITSQALREDSLHSGIYDLSYYRNKVVGLIREGDTLAIMSALIGQKQYFDVFKLKRIDTKNYAQFSQGMPYAIVGDENTRQTRIFKPLDTNYTLVRTLPKLPMIYAASGTENNCWLLYQDTSLNNSSLKIYNTSTGMEIVINGVEGDWNSYVFSIYPEQGIFTASHPTDGTIMAFNLDNAKLAWVANPDPVTISAAGTILQQAEDNKLFKVLIKQGSDNVNRSYYNYETNQLTLVKNHDKLITIDADAKCAVRWEQFYKDAGRVTDAQLLPGDKYILYSEERWKKRPGLEDENQERNSWLYPYTVKVYDRSSRKIVFQHQSQNQPATRIINDSLICWYSNSYTDDIYSLTVYNLNQGTAKNYQPAGPDYITDYIPAMISGNMYFLLTTTGEDLSLVNEQGKKLFTRSYPGENNAVKRVTFLANSPYFYFTDSGKDVVNQLYKIEGDSVTMVRKFPLNSEVLTGKATPDGCYFMYKKEFKRKSGKITHFRYINMLTGQDRLIDSLNSDDTPTNTSYEIFPDQNFFTQSDNIIIRWRELNTGYEFKDFGRDEPTIISIAYSPDGRYLAAANPDGKVMLWDLGTGKETKSLNVGSSGYITKLAFSGDGKYLAASSGDIWETATGKNTVSVTDGSIWAVNSIDFSTDGQRIVSGGACIISWDAADGSKMVFHQEPQKEDMDSTNNCWNPNGCVDPNYGFMVLSTALHPNSRDFVTGNKSGVIQHWNTEERKLHAYKVLEAIPGQKERKVYDLKYTRDGNHVIAVQQKCIYRLNAITLQVEDSLLLPQDDEILGIDIGFDGQSFGCITRRQNGRIVQIRNTSDLEVQREFYTEGAGFNKISFSPNKKHAATASDDGFCTIWDLASGKPAMYLSTIGDYGNIMVTPDNFYMASKSALDGVTFFKDSSFYSFDQFDLYLNRPDIVLSRLGYASPELVNFYKNAYYKRLKKITGTVNDSLVSNYTPVLKLTNKRSIPVVTSTPMAGLYFEIADSSARKGQVKIFINGNLIKQQQFSEIGTSLFTYSDSVLLNQGVNNIEAVYISGTAIESHKEKIAVTYAPLKPIKPRVWFVGVGISKYQDTDMSLKYPVKDIRDLVIAFKKKYPGLIIDTLLNEKATRENILALHDKLKSSSINDKVIVSFNGHGLLSDSLDWYFATYDVDFKKPEGRGLPYSMMEGILDGIPARQKLLLMDACHSGEVDKESDITFENKGTALEQNVVATARGLIVKGDSKVGLQTSFELMQDMFANLNNGNGTTVLSAAGGKEYALESDKWKNGVFTYSVLNAFKDTSTDENGNKKISVKELKKAVFTAVKTLTGGRQKPTSRVEVLDDWDIWTL